MWLATQEKAWSTLAVIPAGVSHDPDFSVTVAMSLARTGMVHLGSQVHVADATRLSLRNSAQFLAQLKETMQSGPVIIALSPVSESSVTVPLARGANAALLCVQLGVMRLSDAKSTVKEIGRQHFLGAVTFR
jgi:hypothetical protein